MKPGAQRCYWALHSCETRQGGGYRNARRCVSGRYPATAGKTLFVSARSVIKANRLDCQNCIRARTHSQCNTTGTHFSINNFWQGMIVSALLGTLMYCRASILFLYGTARQFLSGTSLILRCSLKCLLPGRDMIVTCHTLTGLGSAMHIAFGW